MKKILSFYLLITTFLIGSDWVEYTDGLINSTTLVIMLKDNQATKLGYEEPKPLSDFPLIQDIVTKYGNTNIQPLFSDYKNFTEIGKKGSKTDQLNLTKRAMNEGKDLI